MNVEISYTKKVDKFLEKNGKNKIEDVPLARCAVAENITERERIKHVYEQRKEKILM